MSQLSYRNRTISAHSTLLEALKKMDQIDKKLLLVFDEQKFIGLISAGDIQRAIIQNKPLESKVINCIRTTIKLAKLDDSFETIKCMMVEFRMELCPVLNEDNEIVKLYFWEDIFEKSRPHHFQKIELPVVIMAGGLGTRLKPLTNVLPKPLLPIGEHTMLEEIINRFSVYGCNDFFISVNYKADLITYYIDNLKLSSNISFFNEPKPQGTAGSLSLLKGKINKTFIVSNCDILIDQDYSEILDFHHQNKNELTVVAALKNYSIPYGTLVTGDNGELLELKEKPNFSVLVNTGMYILEPNLLDEIPTDTFFHITHLIEKLKSDNRSVGVFPISEGSWLDTGEWSEYNKTLEKISRSHQ